MKMYIVEAINDLKYDTIDYGFYTEEEFAISQHNSPYQDDRVLYRLEARNQREAIAKILLHPIRYCISRQPVEPARRYA